MIAGNTLRLKWNLNHFYQMLLCKYLHFVSCQRYPQRVQWKKIKSAAIGGGFPFP